LVIERADQAVSDQVFEILGTKLLTQFSNNIRNNFGFLNRAEADDGLAQEKLFVQEGRKVFREVCPMVAELIGQHLAEHDLQPQDVQRFWLHQANLSMNQLIVKKLLGREATEAEAPVILDRYANTSSAGSVIAFHLYQDDLASGALGVLSSFGAGYSIGSVVLRKRSRPANGSATTPCPGADKRPRQLRPEHCQYSPKRRSLSCLRSRLCYGAVRLCSQLR